MAGPDVGRLSGAARALRARFGGRIERGGGLSITVDPSADRLASKVEAWAETLDDHRAFFGDAEDLIAHHQKRHFDTEGGSTGSAWSGLSPRYGAWKAENFPGMPILQLHGHLHKAVVDRGAGYKSRIGKKSATFGIDPSFTTSAGARLIRYARAHTTGAKGLPRRPVYRWDPTVGRASGGTMPLGTALSQLRQAYIVAARRAALGADSKALAGTGSAERLATQIDSIKRYKTR